MIQLGHKMHFICADRCEFAIATDLENGYIVSTVGEYTPRHKGEWESVRASSDADMYYETMVFTYSGHQECGCPDIDDYSEVSCCRYETAKEATKGHQDLCESYK